MASTSTIVSESAQGNSLAYYKVQKIAVDAVNWISSKVSIPRLPKVFTSRESRLKASESSLDSLGRMISELTMHPEENLCATLTKLEKEIVKAIKKKPAKSVSVETVWKRHFGDHLLALVSTQRESSCYSAALRLALMLALNLPGTEAVDRKRFATESGLSAFCNTEKNGIVSLLEAESPWKQFERKNLFGREMPYTWINPSWTENRRVLILRYAYAGHLSEFCPQFAERQSTATALLQQLGFEERLKSGVKPASLTVDRNRIFSSSLSFLTGNRKSLLAGLPDVSFKGEPGLDYGGVQRDWFTSIIKAVFEEESTDPLGSLFRTVKRDPDDGGDYLVWDPDKHVTKGLKRPMSVPVD